MNIKNRRWLLVFLKYGRWFSVGLHRSIWAGGEEQVGVVLGRIGVGERVVGGALVHRWRF